MKNIQAIIVTLLGFVLVAGASIAEAVSIKIWKDFPFFSSTQSEIRKALGKPDATGDMDSYVISDSPDFIMMGLIGYEKGKVAAVCAVLQPKLTYKKVRDIQLQCEDVKFVSEDKNGVLFKYKKPAPNGPNFLVISPPDDKTTGPMFMESRTNPFAQSGQKEPGKKAATPANPPVKKSSQKKPHVDLSLLDKDVFDWQMLDDQGKLELIRKIKNLWRATGAETDKNAIAAEVLLKKIKFPDQSLVVDQACEAAGIDPAPFRKMRNNPPQTPAAK